MNENTDKLIALIFATVSMLVERAFETTEDFDQFELLEVTEATLYGLIGANAARREALAFCVAAGTAVESLEKAIASEAQLSGKTTGLASLDRKIGGLCDGELILLAGCPGMGKTSLATTIAFNVANQLLEECIGITQPGDLSGATVAYFSLSTSAEGLASHILAQVSGVNPGLVPTGGISQERLQRFVSASQRFKDLRLFIDDTPALSIAGLRARAKRLKRRHDIGLIVVDDLRLVQGTSSGGSWLDRAAEVSRGLKALALELALPVIALFQLPRASEACGDKPPNLSDLRVAGDVAADADVVWFLHRDVSCPAAGDVGRPGPIANPEVSRRPEGLVGDLKPRMDVAELIVAKQPRRTLGIVLLHFDAASTRFSDIAVD